MLRKAVCGTTRLVELFLIPLSSAALHVILLKEGYFELTQKMTTVDILCRSYHVFPQLALADIPPAVPACRFAHSCLYSPSDFQNSTVLICSARNKSADHARPDKAGHYKRQGIENHIKTSDGHF